jgi:predicted DNA-binding transcriptional regulator YafY
VPSNTLRSAHPLIPRVERYHALIETLRVRAPRPLTGEVLARELGVSVRTVERDVAELTAMGVPILVNRGPGGGYRIDARRELAPVVLTPGEASALIASLVALGPGASATAQSAMDKLLSALGPDGEPRRPIR